MLSSILLLMAWSLVACAGSGSMGEPAGEEALEPLPAATEGASSEPMPEEEVDEFPGEEMPSATEIPPQILDPSPTAPADPQTIALVPESRLLTFEWPPEIRVGDSDIIRVALVVDEAGTLTPTAVFADHEVQGQAVTIENLYDTHFIRLEARLDLAGVEVLPEGIIDQSLAPGEPLEFSWSVKPMSTGTFRGSVWLKLRYVPKAEGETEEKLLFNQLFEIRAVNLLGLGGTPARILGAIGSVVGSLLGLDDIFSWLRRLRKKPSMDV